MSDLIERLVTAKGSDREIDQDIFHELGLCQTDEGACNDYKAPAYTGSIDAASGLLPEGWVWARVYRKKKAGRYQVKISKPVPGSTHPEQGRQCHAEHALVPIALCIAALKARTHDQP